MPGEKTEFMCLVCGEFAEYGREIVPVSLHYFEELLLNETKDGYLGMFQKGSAHHDCIKSFLEKAEQSPEACAVCEKPAEPESLDKTSKLVVYLTHISGAPLVIEIHDECFREIKHRDFPFIKLPREISEPNESENSD